MIDLDTQLHDLLYKQAESYYFEGSDSTDFESECPELIKKFKQVFKDASWITPEQVKKTQELVNQMANVAQNMAKLPVIIKEPMTGQEWYEHYQEELKGEMFAFDSFDDNNHKRVTDAIAICDGAAKRAAGINRED